ncbi:hypothetical protein [Lentiprolixibacter aurantiacus]|uniref:Uncharacterized protein n=1 Tax=Lentiprolixibacter aurantiacus TaxID=2993939 RepID=A0AAE3SNV1_9FLAO|nr:hypothetical protein [Lentiprolixibacter aurantiacus]MCX2719925.1 hypothetical protein [Lentiprolixibacter aurantiacus]
MMDFIYRPKNQNINEAEWQELNALTEQWRSDLSFYAEDLQYLHQIIGNYFLKLSKKGDTELVRKIKLSLIEMDEESQVLQDRVKRHLHYLQGLMDGPFK